MRIRDGVVVRGFFRFALLAAGLLIGRVSGAASLGFEAIATSATSICAGPCYEIHMYVEDPTRSLDIFAVQFSVDVLEGATVSNIPIYPTRNGNVSGGRFTYHELTYVNYDEIFPWGLANAIAQSPWPGFDIQLVAATPVWPDADLDGYLSYRSTDLGPCIDTPRNPCSVTEPIIMADNVERNRLHLGRFNVTRDPTANSVSLRIGGEILAHGAELQAELQRLDGAVIVVPYSAPEPARSVLFGMMLAGVGLLRRSREKRTS